MIQLEEKLQQQSFEQSDFIGQGWRIGLLRWYRQFIALNDKNARIFYRRPMYLIMILLMPAIAMLIFFVGNGDLHHSNSSDKTTNQLPTLLKGLGECDAFFSSGCVQVAFSPATTWTRKIMHDVAQYNQMDYGESVREFSSSADLRRYVASNLGKVQFSVFFNEHQPLWYAGSASCYGSAEDCSKIPSDVHNTSSYVIFYNSTHDSNDRRSKYHAVNFPMLVLQKSIEEFMLRSKEGYSNITYQASFAQTWSYNPGNLGVTQTPTNGTCGEVAKDMFNVNIAAPILFTYVFQFIGILCFQVITEERHKGLLRSLRTLGLNHSAYWTSWFLLFQGLAVAASVIALIMAAIIQPHVYVLQKVDLGIMFLFVWMGISCSVGNAMFLGSFTAAGNWSSIVTLMNFLGAFLTLIFMIFTLDSYQELSYYVDEKLITKCLLTPSSYSAVYNKRTAGGLLQFVIYWLPWFHIGRVLDSMFSFVQYGDSFGHAELYGRRTMYYYKDYFQTQITSFVPPSVSWTLGIMMLNTFIYVVLAWLCEQLIEGIPWDVIFIPSWARKSMLGLDNPVLMGDVRGAERQKSATEESIRAYKISKTFDKVQALKEVSFDIQKGEVFCLLGHNGAGKSTLFNILSGVTPTTHGNVYILGHDCNFEMMDIQQMIGICPQSDYLWDELTAMEHMRIYARFKGLRLGPQLDAACENILAIVGLLDRRNTLAKNFSGGMKRRLSAAMSVIGQVKVLYLDEPTTGLDPLSRRAIWDMISIMKKDRVVVLTTHNLEEADYLSDRIMVLQTGQVKALGTSLNLKQSYGTGYQVRVIVDPEVAEPVSKEVIKFLPRSSLGGDTTAGNIIVRVSQMDYIFFGRFLQWLELVQHQSSALSAVIKEWGISNTTLEQVFLVLSESAATNYVGSSASQNVDDICPLCDSNPKQAISFIHYSDKQQLMIPRAICKNCEAVPYFLVDNEEVSPLLQLTNSDEERIACSQLFSNARNKRQYALTSKGDGDSMEDAFMKAIVDHTGGGGSGAHGGLVVSEELVGAAQSVAARHIEMGTESQQAGGIESNEKRKDLRIGRSRDIFVALSIKNLELQSYQRCSTCCTFFFMAMLIVAIVILGLVWQSGSTCPQGYIVEKQKYCDVSYQASYLFNAQDSVGYFYHEKETADFNSSYLVYLVPRYDNLRVHFYEDKTALTESTASLPYYSYPYRMGTIWTGAAPNSSLYDYGNRQTMFFPKGKAKDSSKWNSELYQYQKNLYTAVKNSVDNCYYSPDVFVNTTSSKELRKEFGMRFPDAILDCPGCTSNKSYFRGTLWVSSVASTAYPYMFMNSPLHFDTSSYYYQHSKCQRVAATFPLKYSYDISVENLQLKSYYAINNTIQAMQFVNSLTNSLYDPAGQDVLIQGAVSYYSNVTYSEGAVTYLVFLLTMLFVLIMNNVFPMAVWRLSYERIARLRLMMNSIGLKDHLYGAGMFLFDFIVMLLINVVVSIILVFAKLSYFANVPIGYLIALSFISSYTFCGMAFCFVRFTPTSSRVTTLIATIMTYVGSIAGCLVCIINYPDLGTWPKGLSFIPYFAQVRTLWVLLKVGRATEEVTFALGILFVFGTVCIIAECIAAQWELIQGRMRQSSCAKVLITFNHASNDHVTLESSKCA